MKIKNPQKEKITMSDPWITSHERKVVNEMMRSGWDNYAYVEKFESVFAKWHGRKYALMTPNCTQAIHLILLSLGIKKGDEVLLPDCTWTGTSAPVTYTKATPVFCDIENDTWCLDASSVEKRITENTKAVIAVDLYGNMPKMEKLLAVCRKRKIPLIEDAAEALGSKYKGKRAGSFGIASVFSFHRTKTLTTGEGGMLILDNKKLYDRAKFLRDHGRDAKRSYFVLEAAPKYMPSNLQAALGLAQFDRVEELVKRKRYILHLYKKFLGDISDITLNMETKDVYNGAWAPSLIFGKTSGLTGKAAMEFLKKKGFPTRPFFYPLSSMPAYEKYKTGSAKLNPVAYSLSHRGITLPASFSLSESAIKRYSDAIKEILKFH
ncbi:MAG: DegT/DnrJ/EryC1/StrS family aminotransferase [bacterium]|nr:DegT/DnrJ/EryC1/StrS family aminotransferase [bacterium]